MRAEDRTRDQLIAELKASGIHCKQAEDLLQESKEWYQGVPYHIQDGLTIIEEGRVVYANDRACEIFGYPRDEYVKMTGLDFAAPEEKERLRRIMGEARQKGVPPKELKYWVIREDGTRRYVHNRYTIISKSNGAACRLVVTTDITEQMEAKSALRASQDLLSTVVACAPIVLFTLNREGVFTSMEGQLRHEGQVLHAMGLSPDGFIGRSLVDLFPSFQDKFYRILEGERLTSNDKVFGQTFHTHAFPFRDQNGEIIGIIGIATDITEQIRAEEALRESEKRYATLFDGVPVGLYRTTPDGQILAANLALVEMLGCSDRESLLAANAGDFYVDIKARKEFQDLFEQEGVVHGFDTRLRRCDGKQIWVRDNSRASRDAAGRVLYYEGNLTDITERKRLEQQMLRTERLTAMGHIAATLAHEIRNPLQAILSNLELVLDYLLEPDERQESLRICEREVAKLVEITQRMLGLTEPEKEAYRPVFITELVQHTLDLLSRQFQAAAIHVTTDFPADLPPVWGAAAQISQVLLNLMINAIEVMSMGGALHIASRMERVRRSSLYPIHEPSREMLVLDLINNGPHIPPEYLEKVFDPFFTTKPDGTGLGLFVCHNIVQQHGGTLVVENLEGERGVAFTLTFPVAVGNRSSNEVAGQVAPRESIS